MLLFGCLAEQNPPVFSNIIMLGSAIRVVVLGLLLQRWLGGDLSTADGVRPFYSLFWCRNPRMVWWSAGSMTVGTRSGLVQLYRSYQGCYFYAIWVEFCRSWWGTAFPEEGIQSDAGLLGVLAREPVRVVGELLELQHGPALSVLWGWSEWVGAGSAANVSQRLSGLEDGLVDGGGGVWQNDEDSQTVSLSFPQTTSVPNIHGSILEGTVKRSLASNRFRIVGTSKFNWS